MDKEFEKWLEKNRVFFEYEGYTEKHIAKAAWNASKQYWIDKAVEAVKDSEFMTSDEITKAIKKLKK